MITEVKMYSAHCDNCKEPWFDEHNGWCAMGDENLTQEQLNNAEWHTDGEKHYCPKCWSMDDNDNIIIKKLDGYNDLNRPLDNKHEKPSLQ